MAQRQLAAALTGLMGLGLMHPAPLVAQVQASVALVTDLEVLPGPSGLMVRLVSSNGQAQAFASVQGQQLVAEISGAVSQLTPDRVAQRTSGSRALQNLQIAQVGPDRLRLTATVPANTTVLATPGPRGVELQLINPELAGRRPVTPPGQVPPLIGQAIAPPLGDNAVSNVSVPGIRITFSNTQRISRLVLSNANVSDVLAMLARAARTNLVFQVGSGSSASSTPASASSTGTTSTPTTAAPISQKISLDLANVTVEEAFNSIVSISGLQAARMGNTILVGDNLPSSAVKLVSRTVRLNQAKAGTAANYLNLQGAAVSTITVPRQFVPSGSGSSGSGTASGGSGTTVSSDIIVQESGPVITTLQPPSTPGVYYPLKGLTVASDERLNQVTIVGREELVKLAADYLKQLDLRKRQVSINVKVVDLNLADLNEMGVSFSFRVGDTFVTSQNGVLGLNLGPVAFPTSAPGTTVPLSGNQTALTLPAQFMARLAATVQSGNAKLLTDPTLVVQEGERSLVNMTSQIVSKITCTTTTTNNNTVFATNPELAEAGLKLGLEIERIDDNGFVTLQVTPDISSPLPKVETGLCASTETFVTPLQRRSTSSGRIRIRDGQTLVLSGIIQDSERNVSYKVPLLGDIPLLGALFRGSTTERDRREVIVVLTPRVIDDTQFSTAGYGMAQP